MYNVPCTDESPARSLARPQVSKWRKYENALFERIKEFEQQPPVPGAPDPSMPSVREMSRFRSLYGHFATKANLEQGTVPLLGAFFSHFVESVNASSFLALRRLCLLKHHLPNHFKVSPGGWARVGCVGGLGRGTGRGKLWFGYWGGGCARRASLQWLLLVPRVRMWGCRLYACMQGLDRTSRELASWTAFRRIRSAFADTD